jgi:hypothetical protein
VIDFHGAFNLPVIVSYSVSLMSATCHDPMTYPTQSSATRFPKRTSRLPIRRLCLAFQHFFPFLFLFISLFQLPEASTIRAKLPYRYSSSSHHFFLYYIHFYFSAIIVSRGMVLIRDCDEDGKLICPTDPNERDQLRKECLRHATGPDGIIN